MTHTTQTVRVSLGDRSYDILVGRGLIAHLGSETAARVAGGKAEGRQAFILSSAAVANRYGTAARESLEAAGFRVHTALIPAGERAKTLGLCQPPLQCPL